MKLIFKRLVAHIPTKLPQGMTEFDIWAKDIIETYAMPDNDSIRFALAVSILHLGATAAFKPKSYFGAVLVKGAASQVAGAVMQDLKDKQAKAAAEAAQQAAVTATNESDVTANEQDQKETAPLQ